MLFYVPLEPYESRYTLQLLKWNTDYFDKNNIQYKVIEGQSLHNNNDINVGQVLDAHGRSYYALSQMMEIVKLLQQQIITEQDIIFFEDMFHPGIEALPYIFDQSPNWTIPKVWMRCLAQTVDPDDFVHKTGMFKWMKRYEQLVNEFATGIIATNEEMVANMKIAGWEVPIYCVGGLPYGKQEVLDRMKNENFEIPKFEDRPVRIAFASRWDTEKQPDFFLTLFQMFYDNNKEKDFEFVILTGSKELKSNSHYLVEKAKETQRIYPEHFKIFTGLSKNEYYKHLANSRVLFNCALQDWTSNTVSEADTLGTNVVFPAYRSFPEIFQNDHSRLYVPWSVDDAYIKVVNALMDSHYAQGEISDWNDSIIAKTLDIISNKVTNFTYLRDSLYYRGNLNRIKQYKEKI